MAAHGNPEYSTATGNDYEEHESTYENFTFLVYTGIILVVCICLGLAIGGVKGAWLTGGALIVVATIAAMISLMTTSKTPVLVVLVLGFLGLVLA
jgi:hypothetical protein